MEVLTDTQASYPGRAMGSGVGGPPSRTHSNVKTRRVSTQLSKLLAELTLL